MLTSHQNFVQISEYKFRRNDVHTRLSANGAPYTSRGKPLLWNTLQTQGLKARKIWRLL